MIYSLVFLFIVDNLCVFVCVYIYLNVKKKINKFTISLIGPTKYFFFVIEFLIQIQFNKHL